MSDGFTHQLAGVGSTDGGTLPKRFALLLGSREYADPELPPLSCPARDKEALRSALGDSSRGDFEVSSLPEDITSERAIDLIETFAQAPGVRDLVLFYFSGHAIQDSQDFLYLCTSSTRVRSPAATAVPVTTVMTILQECRAQAIVLILDCCFSGSISEAFRLLKSSKPVYVISSSTADQASHEKEGDELSYFTKYFVEGITSGRADRDNDGLISLDDAYLYAHNLIEAGPTPQRPVRFIPSGAQGAIVLARNPTARRVTAESLDPSTIPVFTAVRTMVELVNGPHPYQFAVMIRPGGCYYIEDEPYRAGMFTVSAGHTPNLMQTQSGFESDAFFEAIRITEAGRKGKEEINGVVKVRMRVDLADIMFITGVRSGDSEQLRLL